MPKSLYSLILSDEIVAAIDVLAAQEGYSRSAFINHLLAGYTSLSTPENRRRQILEAVQQLAQTEGLRPSISPGGTLTLRTALRYKYNPAVFYVIELNDEADELGELRVGLRTQNQTLLCSLQEFFALWNALESRHLPSPPAEAQHTESDKRYVRALRRPPTKDEPETGRAIAGYISLFDACMKAFFDAPEEEDAARRAARRYRQLLPGLGSALEL